MIIHPPGLSVGRSPLLTDKIHRVRYGMPSVEIVTATPEEKRTMLAVKINAPHRWVHWKYREHVD